jgi:hypothetical protein
MSDVQETTQSLLCLSLTQPEEDEDVIGGIVSVSTTPASESSPSTSSKTSTSDLAQHLQEQIECLKGTILHHFTSLLHHFIYNLVYKYMYTDDILSKKVKVRALQKQVSRLLNPSNSPTTNEIAGLHVNITNRIGTFSRQLHNDKDNNVFYYTDGGRRTDIKLSATRIPNDVARDSGVPIYDGKKGIVRHPKDLPVKNTSNV